MIQRKNNGIITAVKVCLAFVISITLIGIYGGNAYAYSQPEYTNKIFGKDIISIEILAEQTDWDNMINNPLNEQFIMADVIVNGTKFQNVGIRPKGNSSLSYVSRAGGERYSFRLQFDEYIKEQTCFGLKSFAINNMIGDATYMKEYVSYELMRKIGVDAPYFAFADIKVNDANWGLYLTVEVYNDSYEQRVYYDTSGILYNVKSEEVASNKAQSGKDNGGSLIYSDDNPSSYPAIFNNAVGKSTSKSEKNVIAAIKALNNNQDIERYWDVDKILRYFAAHTIVTNFDSYNSMMQQNYFIYEKNGKLTVLPWDYNQAWGGFQIMSTDDIINFPIDTPVVAAIEFSSRPLLERLLTNDDYLKRYHGYLQVLMDEYFADGKFEAKINALDTLIGNYVKNDPTAFYSYEHYKKAINAFMVFGELRAQSIKGQLNGSIPRTTVGQKSNPNILISAGNLNIPDLGTMAMNDKGKSTKKGANDLPNRVRNILMSVGLALVLLLTTFFVSRKKRSY